MRAQYESPYPPPPPPRPPPPPLYPPLLPPPLLQGPLHLHPLQLRCQQLHLHHRHQGIRGLTLSCQAFHRTILVVLLWNVYPNHRVFPSNPFPILLSTKLSSLLRTVFSCLHRSWCQFCAHIWNTFGFWVDICLSMPLDPVLFSWLYVAIVVSVFPLVELSVDALGTQKRKERKSVLVRLQ